MMNEVLYKAVQSVKNSELAFCKFLSANDTGTTGGHQAGIYIPKTAYKILFDIPGERGSNKDKYVNIKWQDDFETKHSRFIYYGKGTRNEYRITRFGKGFPYLSSEYLGDLFILCKMNEEEYQGYILETEEEFDEFLGCFGMSSIETNRLIAKGHIQNKDHIEHLYGEYLLSIGKVFPPTIEIAERAREIYYKSQNTNKLNIKNKPDYEIIMWIDTEYELFKKIENNYYKEVIKKQFNNMDEFVEVANSVLNRRKSRAGKSLEHHLAKVFDYNELKYTAQARTEGKKRPDFIFPSETFYHMATAFQLDELVFLGAKTTCKDRWRQILNEANKIEHKHLFTLQQGISSFQLREMANENVTLVVPRIYHKAYPKEYRHELMDFKTFIEYVKEKQA